LSRAAQADQLSIFGSPGLRAVPAAALLCAAALLSACGSGGFSLEKAEVDRTFYTSNVPAPRTTVEVERVSDEATIRNAVTSADVETLAGAPLPWANAETGARGQVTGIVETRGKGSLCRSFSATRESFDGVGMYRGEACMVASGAWRMQSFAAL
jgi:17 kDa outer membrane surface antigen